MRRVTLLALLALALPTAALANTLDLFVSVASNCTICGAVAKYTIAGATVNPGFSIFFSWYPQGIAASGSDLFVSSRSGGGTVGKYTTSGATVNSRLISGLSDPRGIAVSGSDLFVVNANRIGEYTTAGATVNSALISGLSDAQGIAVSGSDLFVVNNGTRTIGKYTTAGATVNSALISGLSDPRGIAVSGSDLFVTNIGNGTIGKYTTAGATVNSALISRSGPGDIALTPVPEPSTFSTGLLPVIGVIRQRYLNR